MDIATFVVTTLGLALAGVGVALGFRQLKAGIKATKVERVIALHRDLTTGEVGGARDRLTTLMMEAR